MATIDVAPQSSKKDVLAASDLQHESTQHDMFHGRRSRYQNIRILS